MLLTCYINCGMSSLMVSILWDMDSANHFEAGKKIEREILFISV